jgi:hypothetical protein
LGGYFLFAGNDAPKQKVRNKMKNQITKALIAFAILAPSQAAFADLASLQGSWVGTDRICTSGEAPQDNFKPGRDTMELTVSGTSVQATEEINGKSYQEQQTIVSLSEHSLQMIGKKGKSQTILYEVGAHNELVFISADFGQGGSCPQGEGLMTVLQKKQ